MMERKEIRRALACLAWEAKAHNDANLTTILNVVHAAILHNDAHRLVQHLNTYDVMVYHSNDQPMAPCLTKQVHPVERVVGEAVHVDR